jgi:hypothetical protein
MFHGLQTEGSKVEGVKFKTRSSGVIGIVVAICAVLVLVTAGAAMGSALFSIKSGTGDPHGSGGCGGIPDGGTEQLHENIYTTSFGGAGDKSATDPKGCHDDGDPCWSGTSDMYTGGSAQTQMFASLPLGSIGKKCIDPAKASLPYTDKSSGNPIEHGTVSLCSRIQVINPANNKSVVLAVMDSGPWNVNDSAYVMGTARPEAESGISVSGKGTNKAGLDISPTAYNILGGDHLNWKFTTLPLDDGSASSVGCAPTVGAPMSGQFYNPLGGYANKIIGFNHSPHPNGGPAGHTLFEVSPFSDGFDNVDDGAIDLDVEDGSKTPIYASFDGKIVKAKPLHESSYGRGGGVLWEESSDGTAGAVYAHIEFLGGQDAFPVGTIVKKGDQIATIAQHCGNTSAYQCVDFHQGEHLHFQFYINKKGLTKSQLITQFSFKD